MPPMRISTGGDNNPWASRGKSYRMFDTLHGMHGEIRGLFPWEEVQGLLLLVQVYVSHVKPPRACPLPSFVCLRGLFLGLPMCLTNLVGRPSYGKSHGKLHASRRENDVLLYSRYVCRGNLSEKRNLLYGTFNVISLQSYGLCPRRCKRHMHRSTPNPRDHHKQLYFHRFDILRCVRGSIKVLQRRLG